MVLMKRPEKRTQSGQAMVEYIILLSMVVVIYTIIGRALGAMKLDEALLKTVKSDYVRAYKYGHPKAEGPDEGTVKKHPRMKGSESFRIFINPEATK